MPTTGTADRGLVLVRPLPSSPPWRTATEALYSFDDHDVVYIKKRRGFVKLAIETGASLVPVFSFVSALSLDSYAGPRPIFTGLEH